RRAAAAAGRRRPRRSSAARPSSNPRAPRPRVPPSPVRPRPDPAARVLEGAYRATVVELAEAEGPGLPQPRIVIAQQRQERIVALGRTRPAEHARRDIAHAAVVVAQHGPERAQPPRFLAEPARAG